MWEDLLLHVNAGLVHAILNYGLLMLSLETRAQKVEWAKPCTVSIVSCPDPTSHEEKGLVSIELFLGCAKSAVSIPNKPMK